MSFEKPAATRWIVAGVVLLIILRQDPWFWHRDTLLGGILPIALAWQVGISIAAALLWYTATRVAWPDEPSPAAASNSEEGSE